MERCENLLTGRVYALFRLLESLIESPNTTRLLMQVGQGFDAGEGGGGGSLPRKRRGGGDLAFLCGFFFASAMVQEETTRIVINTTLRSDILSSHK